MHVDPAELRRLSLEISAGGEHWLEVFGVPDIQAVMTNDLTGRLTILTSASIEPYEVEYEGRVYEVLGGGAVILH